MFLLYDSSEKMMARIVQRESGSMIFVNKHALTKYPFDELHIGQSFAVPIEDAGRLRALASMRNKRKGKRFSVIVHRDVGVAEVGRIG